MNKKILFLVKIFLLISGFYLTDRFCHKQTKGFTVGKVSSNYPFNQNWETDPIPIQEKVNIHSLLDQTFHFLGSGGQCYVFISDDRTTVIKFFKHHHMRLFYVIESIPLPKALDKIRVDFVNKQRHKLEQLFDSCKMAYDDLKEETTVIYLHLNSTHEFFKKLKLIDKIGNAHYIDLDSTTFVLQKKADLALSKMIKDLKNDNVDGFKDSLELLFKNIILRCQKGIEDTDTGLKRNFGFIENKAISIDIGSFIRNPVLRNRSEYEKEIKTKTLRLKKILEKDFPQYSHLYEESIRKSIALNPGLNSS